MNLAYKVKCSDCKQPCFPVEVKLKYGTTAWLCDMCLKKRRASGYLI